MQVKALAFHAFTIAIPQPDAHIRLVGALVIAETNIPVNFKKAFIDFGNGIDPRRDFSELFSHFLNISSGRVHYELLIIFAVFFEPVFGIILFEVRKERNEFLWKALKIGHNMLQTDGAIVNSDIYNIQLDCYLFGRNPMVYGSKPLG